MTSVVGVLTELLLWPSWAELGAAGMAWLSNSPVFADADVDAASAAFVWACLDGNRVEILSMRVMTISEGIGFCLDKSVPGRLCRTALGPASMPRPAALIAEPINTTRDMT